MANHISELRARAGIRTAKEAAQILKISSGMMYQIEEGLKKPGSFLAIRMAESFECKLEDIFLPFNTTNSGKEKGEKIDQTKKFICDSNSV